MRMRTLGRTGLQVSVLGFGCGAVGGLMVRGDPEDQERAIARALEAGVNYFDTAVQYGDGASERNLGRVLRSLKAKNVIVGTKVRLPSGAEANAAIRESLEGSLQRLGRERVDIFYLHNPVTSAGGPNSLSTRVVLDEVVPTFDRLREEGKIRFLGFTAIGETRSLHEVVDAQVFDVAQVTYNMLNSSAAEKSASRLPSSGLRSAVRPHGKSWCRRRRYPRIGGRRTFWLASAPPNCEPAARPDRFGGDLRGRSGSCTGIQPVGRGGLCEQPFGSGHPLFGLP